MFHGLRRTASSDCQDVWSSCQVSLDYRRNSARLPAFFYVRFDRSGGWLKSTRACQCVVLATEESNPGGESSDTDSPNPGGSNGCLQFSNPHSGWASPQAFA